jgi:hypothetical protein
MPARGPLFITPHAVTRYRERVKRARSLTYEQALGELVSECERARYIRTLESGLELWRGGKPLRLRMRVARGHEGLPQLVTVILGHDGANRPPRKP